MKRTEPALTEQLEHPRPFIGTSTGYRGLITIRKVESTLDALTHDTISNSTFALRTQ